MSNYMINKYQHFDDIATLEGVQPNAFYRPSMGHIVETTRDFQAMTSLVCC